MKNMTNPAWAGLFILLACVLACVALFSHSVNAASVITIGSSIITGAFGYIQGVARSDNKPLGTDMPPNSTLQQTTKIQTPAEITASNDGAELVPKS